MGEAQAAPLALVSRWVRIQATTVLYLTNGRPKKTRQEEADSGERKLISLLWQIIVLGTPILAINLDPRLVLACGTPMQ